MTVLMVWKKRRHSVLNGFISVTFFDTGKVLDTELMSKYHYVCYTNPVFKHKFKRNYEGTSAGREVAGVVNIFSCSRHAGGILHKVSW